MPETCPRCASPWPEGARRCPSCNLADAGGDPGPDATAVHPETRAAESAGGWIPGRVLDGRYRLVALLGRGGMGEVYRAEDLRLEQAVALKVLPAALADDPDMLARFVAEVRIGRQVSHPNVCRLHDLVDIGGRPVLSMEFVDGEDLSALLARIGRMPTDKVVDLARDLCAGLSALHDRGVIHRDLKPANIMIDGRGRARIADFGIAALADGIHQTSQAGTPAYMAPEVLDGRPASVQSDLYALGLVLYEMASGSRLLDARTHEALRRQHEEGTPLARADSLDLLPPPLLRVIRQCLDPDPARRPASALAVLATLPGGDPLQAALAAGETPSPAMVAAANRVGALPAGRAFGLLVAGLAMLLTIAGISHRTTLVGLLSPPKPPAALAERARGMLDTLGHPIGKGDEHVSFTAHMERLRGIRASTRTPESWRALGAGAASPITFLYRFSPEPLVATRTVMRPFGPAESGRVTLNDPPLGEPGMVDVVLDLHGRLLGLRAWPGPVAAAGDAHPEPDWQTMFAFAGLDPGGFQPAAVLGPIPVDADARVAFTARDGTGGDRVEIAARAGRIVWFARHDPGTPGNTPFTNAVRPEQDLALPQWIAVVTVMAASTAMWLAIGLLVRRNLGNGRADRQGAARLAWTLAALSLAGLMLRADHVRAPLSEITLGSQIAGQVAMYAAIIWLVYIALEPIARRRWPDLLVSWNRLLMARFRDPLVGRDVLVGTVAGLAMALILHLAALLPESLGPAREAPRALVVSSLGAVRHFLHFVLANANAAVIIGFGSLLAYLINRMLFRSAPLAMGLLLTSLYFGFLSITGITQVLSPANLLFTLVFALALFRCSLLAAVVATWTYLVVEAVPLTLAADSWYGEGSAWCLAILAGVMLLAWWRSLAGRSPLGAWSRHAEAID